jgi:hypothetical protein
LLLRVGNRFALPPLTRPTNKRSRAGEIFVSIRDKPTAIFSNKRKLSFFGEMTAEPVFKRFRRVFLGQKKCGAYGARTRNGSLYYRRKKWALTFRDTFVKDAAHEKAHDKNQEPPC